VAGSLTYLDSSALVKLVMREAETLALRAFLKEHPFRVSSRIAEVEVIRAVARASPPAVPAAQALMRRIGLIELDAGVLHAAAHITPAELRTLDAVHVASALSLADELDVVVAYDARLAAAVTRAGVEVVSPR
jgi:predicted nucleic acid-binding protein